ncbi:LANO_0F16380g1_1 [Lachancea nothofagi CBS 11611]|uniref:MICOS complex subunit n=1 Tax=Lachancea nothofagi CBS 11611 TaxID=1266666 RepID=A0A1G4KD27_9SACH|nr:LANO_0F16380g1_1 [Lachancea nothofagi CBS 11611]
MAPNFYRPADIVAEAVIPPETGSIISSEAKEAAPSHDRRNSVSHQVAEIIGDNRLMDGISVRSPTYMTQFFNSWRSSLTDTLEKARNTIDEKSSIYYSHERRLTTTVANLHSDPREELLPGLTYSLVAAMSGSVLTKNKHIFARIVAPLALGTMCFSYVLPVTSSNTFDLMFDLEHKAFPRFAQGQLTLFANCKHAVRTTVAASEETSKAISGSLTKAAHLIKEWTGLNV